ncbi:MAG: hypothetical protein HOP10_00550 [Chitinophagaceae bacterium]|nr:hypothetical protein [Chitinophagaceae bacterium]
MNIYSVIFVSVLLNYCTTSKVVFTNKELEKEVNLYVADLADLKEEYLNIPYVVLTSIKMGDSLIFSLGNSYPELEKVKVFAKHQGFYFCFGPEYPMDEYYEVINPEPAPDELKKKYEEIKKGFPKYEPPRKLVVFYKGKLISSVSSYKE